MAKLKMWPAGIFVLLGLNVAIVATTIAFATTTDSTVVEARPYERALKWDEEQHKRTASAALRWTCDARLVAPDTSARSAVVELSFTDSSGAPVDGLVVGVVAFHHAHAGVRRVLELKPVLNTIGLYRSSLDEPKGLPLGLWRLTIAANRSINKGGTDQAFELDRDLMLTIDPAILTPNP